jgi:hypothetical protein
VPTMVIGCIHALLFQGPYEVGVLERTLGASLGIIERRYL